MSRKVEIDGEEVEVYTAAERDTAIADARTAVEGEWKPKLTAAETETARVAKLLEDRTKEFGQGRAEFKRLSDEQYAKLDEKDRTIYDNQVVIADKDKTITESNQKAHESSVDTAIKAKVGSDVNLFTKVKEMYGLINLEDLTPDQIVQKVNVAFGAVGTREPDLLAAAGFGTGGGFEPPRKEAKDSFADSERGKELAKALGIPLEAPKQA